MLVMYYCKLPKGIRRYGKPVSTKDCILNMTGDILTFKNFIKYILDKNCIHLSIKNEPYTKEFLLKIKGVKSNADV